MKPDLTHGTPLTSSPTIPITDRVDHLPIIFDTPSLDTLFTNRQPRIQAPVATPPVSRNHAILALFMITMFLSALLVFSLQPMFAKMVLPLLGGSPGVWNTAMLFFQTVLLIGYIYAHLTTNFWGVKRQVWVHFGLMSIVTLILPIGIASGWNPPTKEAPVLWLIGLFAVSVGLPFFAVATNAPLVQRWFSYTSHSSAGDPYFLYAASNLGSIVALLGYPFFIEPFLHLRGQSMAWAGGYFLLIVLLGLCAFILRSTELKEAPTLDSTVHNRNNVGVPWPRRLHWLVLALVPSSLLLGVTTHITTDVASVPFLWVLPLTLYLLTYVLVFARRPWLTHSWMVKTQPLLVILLAITFYFPSQGLYLFTLHLCVFFVTTMVCHGELARRRPSPEKLTEFYLWMSFGGMLGGVFNVLLAPILFNAVYEYPLALVLACFLRPQNDVNRRFCIWKDLGLPGLLMVIPGFLLWRQVHPKDFGLLGITLFLVVFGLSTYSFKEQPLRFGLGIVAILMTMSVFSLADTEILVRERSFFGVSTVQRTKNKDFNLLIHGNTTHGAEHTAPSRWKEPLTYYHKEGPIGQIFTALDKVNTINQVAIVGLGSGSMMCYRQPGQTWTYFEIDPVVEQLARDTRYFHFMSECAKDSNVILGDARVSLRKVPDKSYDLLILDAFSSDSIPMHLITRQSLSLFRQKLTSHGFLVFHLSNRFLDLSGVLANLAKAAGMAIKHQRYYVNEKESQEYKTSSEWVIMAPLETDLFFLENSTRWEPLLPNSSSALWTDDFSDIFSVLKKP